METECIVTVSTGKLKGKTEKNLHNGQFYSFRGIPYAKPPIGPLRFKAPQPAEPWTGVRDATEEGPECFSKHIVLKTLIGVEDCLTLNVYTPNLPVKHDKCLKPVMVWIHGGGFTAGSASSEIYGPEFLMTEDIVLVTINYRIGIFGFLSLEDPDLDVPGNAGLKDMVMALKWVQRNIKNFCGDPKNVTIFGESAGGASVHYLILSPMARGLFHKAIIQSGCALNVWAKARRNVLDVANVLNLETTDEKKILAILQSLPVETLYQAFEIIPDPTQASLVRPFGPVIERKSRDNFITQYPLDIIKSGNYNHVPIIIGFTTREGMLMEIWQKPNPFQHISDFEMEIPNFLKIQKGSELAKQLAQQIKQFYYGDKEVSVDVRDPFYLIETDNFFVRELLQAVKYHSQTSRAPIYLYRMSLETGLNLFKNINEITAPGVCHADDLGYLFKTLLTPAIQPGSDEEIGITRFVKFWTNFAESGNPNPKRPHKHFNVNWKPVTKNALNFIDIGKNLSVGVNPEAERMAFWDNVMRVNPVHKL